ncbi:MAG: molecular chaperone HtpG [Thiomonas sp.]|jgi:molecular chaperone HtpG
MSTEQTTAAPANVHTHAFQAEVRQLLHLVTHSLYSNRDIFLRELISNASDACDKLRFQAIDDPALMEDDPNLRIRITVDPDKRLLTISDNGIGLSLEEAVEHLGTIAKSGTREFMQKLGDAQKPDAALIGQFGVGFYSGFMVADRITVESRKAGMTEDQGVRWVSDGTGEFTVETITRKQRGTDVILHLRPDAEDTPHEDKIDKYLRVWTLKDLIGKYSDHISLPIEMRKEKWDAEQSKYVPTDEWEQVNSAAALWTRNKSEITDAQYLEFYKQLTGDTNPPLRWTHNRVEGRSEYIQLLYIPSKAPMDLWDRQQKAGVKLYVKRVFITDDADSLMPTYLRFVRGVIDSSDLPLNVSREMLQESRDVRAIREGSVKRVLSMLEDMASSDDPAERDKYATFWREFGAVLKEGFGEDFANRERLARLLRAASTHNEDDAQNVSLADYVARMKEGQKAIYYITAETPKIARSSPQLEIFRQKGIEVLLLTDRVDEWMLGFLHEFDGKPLQSVARGAVDLSEVKGEDKADAAKDDKAQSADHQALIDRFKQALGERVQDVRVSARLVESPACLVATEGGMSTHLVRLLKQAGREPLETKPVLEINPRHPLVQRVAQDQAHAAELAQVVFDQALLAEGGQLDDPAAYVRRVNALLVGAANGQ